MAEPSPEPAAEPVSQTPTVEGTLLDYAVSDASRWKGLYYSADPAELQLVMAELDAAGIPYQVYNQNAPHLGPYAGGTVPEIHVRGPDMERAGELVRVLFESPDAVEPAPEPEDGSADMSVDADGNPMPLAVVAEYDTPSKCATRRRCLPRRGSPDTAREWCGAPPKPAPDQGRRAATSSASPPPTLSGRGRSSTVPKTRRRRKGRSAAPTASRGGSTRSGRSGGTSSATWPGAPRRSSRRNAWPVTGSGRSTRQRLERRGSCTGQHRRGRRGDEREVLHEGRTVAA